MRKTISKAAVAAVAALSLCAVLVASTEPASAAFRLGGGGFGGGWHGGGWGGGWRGGGWGGGGWRGGWGGGGWRTAGWGWGGGWRGGNWNGCGWGGCGWGGGWWWPGVATGVALASTYPYWGGDYGYGDYGYGNGGYPYDNGCIQRRPVYSRWGRYLGRRWVDVCY